MRVQIEMEVGDTDPSRVLELAQEMALELSLELAQEDDDELSEDEKEIVRNDVSVQVVDR